MEFDRLVENFGESARSKIGNDSLAVVAEDVMSVVMSAGILKVHPVVWFRTVCSESAGGGGMKLSLSDERVRPWGLR